MAVHNCDDRGIRIFISVHERAATTMLVLPAEACASHNTS